MIMQRKIPVGMAIAALALVILILLPSITSKPFRDYWLTPDQQGRRLEAAGNYAEAATRYTDPLRRGIALYRAGDFEAAATAFARVNSPEAAFNRGNALVLLGQYDQAIASYDGALQQRPGWQEAEANRKLASLRKERREANSGGDEGTGGMLGADGIVFDQNAQQSNQSQQVQQDGAGMSATEVEALWMRRVQTRPADFLRAKFAYQLTVQGSGEQQ